jgi:hypothetical protein
VFSAIVIVTPEFVTPEIRDDEEDSTASDTTATVAAFKNHAATPLAMVEVLGRSVMARLADELGRAGIEEISMFGNGLAGRTFDSSREASAQEAWSHANQQWITALQSGAEAILVMRLGAYVEVDFKDALIFHVEHGHAITRAFDRDEPLDLWIIDPTRISEESDLLTALNDADSAHYLVRGYINRLEHPCDLRRLVVDSLTARCSLRPRGEEVRPGVWLDNGAQVHRDARVVAPAFIGRGAVIGEQCLITRCSSIESDCQIDYGTVVEDSSILSNSYVGIGLDLSHSIVHGNYLLNLERGVALEIADPCVIRQNRPPRHDKSFRSPARFGFGAMKLSPVEDRLR